MELPLVHMPVLSRKAFMQLKKQVCRDLPCKARVHTSFWVNALMLWRCFLALLLLLVVNGCQTYTDQNRAALAYWQQGDLVSAERELQRKATHSLGTKDHVLWHLEHATSQLVAGDAESSLLSFDKAENQIEAYEQKGLISLSQTSMELGTYISNQANRPYVGRSYDKTMLHVYKALLYWKLASDPDKQGVRTELLKGRRRQQEALQAHRREVERAKSEEAHHQNRQQLALARQDPTLDQQIQVIQSEWSHLTDYDDFANPYLEFLSCLYLACHGSGQTDLADAEVALKRLQGMVEESMPAWDQLTKWLNGVTENKSSIPRTIIVFETGRAASLEQIRIDIPIIMGDVSYLGAAFPQLVFHDRFYSGLQVQAGGESHGTFLVCDIDSLVAYDYKKNFPIMLARTLASSVAKGVAAYMANRAASDQDAVFGLLMKVGTAIAQAAVNIADTRSWNTLPKQVHFCQIDTPPGGVLTLSTTDDRFVSDLILDEKKSHMILVRSIGMNAPLTIDAFEL